MNKIQLSNNINVIFKENKNTPRIALCFYMSLNNPEKKAGTHTLMNRLFLQGTTNRSAEEIAQELDENAIDCYSEMKYDYIKFKVLCLNEDLPKALDILADIIHNSHFNDLPKEIFKIKGELLADLDSPKTMALDNYYKNLFKGSPYGNTYTKILEDVDGITKDDIIEAYNKVISNSYKTISVVGDFNVSFDDIKAKLETYFGKMQTWQQNTLPEKGLVLKETDILEIAKDDAAQAQVIKGWMVPSIYSDEYPAFALLNTILGSSGLSSRLFVELRDKKGLAYTVRSSYETYMQGASFNVYIGTDPKNISTALTGFDVEIQKLKDEPVSDEELANAKNNIIGKRLFFTETNIQQAGMMGLYEVEGLGYDYEKALIEKLRNVKKEDIQNVALKYLCNTYILSLLAPKEYLKKLEPPVL